MAKSMTGFGSGIAENDDYKVQFEVKAVNQRYLDIEFRMPRLFLPFEERMRAAIKKTVVRGKLAVFVTVEDKRTDRVLVKVNRELAQAYQAAFDELSDLWDVPRQPHPERIAILEGVMTVTEKDDASSPEEVALEALASALQGLDQMRLREGENLKRDFAQRLGILAQMTDKLDAMADDIVASYREKLTKLLSSVTPDGDFDEVRLVQEVALYADKVNFTEEIVRLRSHLAQFRNLLEAEEAVGRKLDFLLQEMNRETNTIGSKANHAAAAHLIVDMKGEIEKIREQAQNIE